MHYLGINYKGGIYKINMRNEWLPQNVDILVSPFCANNTNILHERSVDFYCVHKIENHINIVSWIQ